MTFLVIHERGNWSAIRLAKTIEEAKKELLKMVQEATVEWGDVFRISKGPKSRAAAKHLQEHGYSTDHPEEFCENSVAIPPSYSGECVEFSIE